MNKLFKGAVIYIRLTEPNLPKDLPGSTVRVVRKVDARSRVHAQLGRTDLTWEGVVENAQDRRTIGRIVYFNENLGIILRYDGAKPAHITLEQLLRTCHADPQKILGNL